MSHQYWDDAITEVVGEILHPQLWGNDGSTDTFRGLFYEDEYIMMAYKAWMELPAETGQAAIINLLIGKQRDYGPNNIMEGPVPAETGIKVRLFDKVARYENLTTNMVEPTNETLMDTLLDIIGYVAISKMVKRDYMYLPLKGQ